MNVPFLDLKAEFSVVEADIRRRIDGILASQHFVLGPQTAELEEGMSRELAVDHAIACSSGSDALLLALLALGIGPGDAVIVPAFTFFASAGAVVRVGATPVFCDIEAEGFAAHAPSFRATLERCFERGSDGAWVVRQSGERLRALLPVHIFGRAVASEELLAWAAELGVAIIGDAAQALGARGPAGGVASFGDVACFSFYPTKNLGTGGDGGLVTTSNAELAARLRRLRVHGAQDVYMHTEVGINARMGEFQAAVVNAKLPWFAERTQRRRELAARYDQALGGVAGLVTPPALEPEAEQVFHQYAVRISGRVSDRGAEGVRSRRDRVAELVGEQGVDTRVFYPTPLHQQPCFANLVPADLRLPHSERACAEVLCLPVHPDLSDAQVDYAAAQLVAALATIDGRG